MAQETWQNITVQGLYDDATGLPIISAVGGPAPTSALLVGASDGTDIRALSVTLAGSPAVEALNVYVVNSSSTASTVNQGTQGTIGQSWFVELTDGTNVIGVSAHPLFVQGTVSSTQGTSPWVDNITQWNSVALGSPTAWGVAPTGNVIGVNSELFAGNTPLTVTLTGSPAVEALNVFVANTVSTTVTGTVTVSGSLTNNNAAPTTNNVGALGYIATASPEAYTQGDQVLGTTSLGGAVRMVPVDESNASSLSYFSYDSAHAYKSANAGTATALWSIQSSSASIIYLLRELEWLTDGSVALFQLIKNATLTGTSFAALTGTHVNVDTAGSYSGGTGTVVMSGYVGAVPRSYDSLLTSMAAGAPGDTFTMVVTGFAKTNAVAQIRWSEQSAAL